jgi:cell division protein FtsL
MTEGIIIAIITGGLTLIGVIISNLASARKTQATIETKIEVQNTKIDELTREVRLHNNFAQRVPILEEQMKVANHRIGDLEKADGQ